MVYLCTDVIPPANMFEAFRDTCLEHYSLDPAHFYTSPGLARKACLKKTGVRLELLTDPDMLLMLERFWGDRWSWLLHLLSQERGSQGCFGASLPTTTPSE